MNLGRLGIIIPRRFFNYASSTAGLRALAEDMAVFGPPPPPGSYQTTTGQTVVPSEPPPAPPLTGAPILGLNPVASPAQAAAQSAGPMGIPVVGWLAIVGAVALMAFSGGSTSK